MKSFHKQLWELTQRHDWSYALHAILTKDEVLGLLREYTDLKAANKSQPQNNAQSTQKDFDMMQNDDILGKSTTGDK